MGRGLRIGANPSYLQRGIEGPVRAPEEKEIKPSHASGGRGEERPQMTAPKAQEFLKGGVGGNFLQEVSLPQYDKYIYIRFDDDGPGLPGGKLEAIFDRFYSERPSGEKFGTHSGLGLSISKQIVEAHGGTIHAENRMGPGGHVQGARFTVRLPALPPE